MSVWMSVAISTAMIVSCGDGKTNSGAKENNDGEQKEAVAETGSAGEGRVVNLTSAQFRQLVADYTRDPSVFVGSEPCIVDFWAEWCGPCRQLSPTIDKLAETSGITVYKVNVDECGDVVTAYGIEAIPQLMFCGSKEVVMYDGDMDLQSLTTAAKNFCK